MHTIERDLAKNLQLLRDHSDPPRYYLQQRHRRELIAIGDERLARSRFAIWRNRSPSNQGHVDGCAVAATHGRPIARRAQAAMASPA